MKTKHFNKNQGFAHVAILFILVAAAVILVGFNKFGNKFLASPVCTTTEKLATLKVDMTALEKQIADVNTQITANNAKIVSTQSSLVTKNSEITKTQSLIYSDSTIASYKKTSDNAYLLWQKNKTRPYKNKYDQYLGVYNTAVASNSTNNAKLATLNAEKAALDAQVIATDKTYVELNASLAKYSSDLVTLKASIANAESNPCPTKETVCTDKIDDDQDGKVDCNDSDCSTNSACVTTPGGGNPGGTNPGGTNPGGGNPECTTDGDCGAGKICSNGSCVDDGKCESDTDCKSGESCNTSTGECGEKICPSGKRWYEAAQLCLYDCDEGTLPPFDKRGTVCYTGTDGSTTYYPIDECDLSKTGYNIWTCTYEKLDVPPPVCGDGMCSGGETKDSCPQDCGCPGMGSRWNETANACLYDCDEGTLPPFDERGIVCFTETKDPFPPAYDGVDKCDTDSWTCTFQKP